MIKFVKINEVYSKIVCEPDLLYELADEFSVFVDGYKHMPKYKSGMWDGKIRYINKLTKQFYNGLLFEIYQSCVSKGYSEFKFDGYDTTSPFTEESIVERLDDIELPYPLYDYQLRAINECLVNKTRLILSATSSGKSLMLYCIARLLHDAGIKTMITVGSITLINQIESDFKEYAEADNFDIDAMIHKVYDGAERNTNKLITISTWQSINRLRDKKDKNCTKQLEFMSQFDAVMSDEVHECDKDSMTAIMQNAVNAFIRCGFTGTLDTKTQRETLVGLYGKVIRVKTTRELIDEGKATPLKIKAIVLEHDVELRKLVYKMNYQDEIDTIMGMRSRNKFISTLASNLEGNTIILVRYIQKHAVPLKEMLESMTDKKVILLDKDTPGELREEIRKSLEDIDNCIIIATYKLMSTGVSIKNLKNIIFGLGLKREIAVLQSLGRLLRLHANKIYANLFDIVDDFSHYGKDNHTLSHFRKRFEYYTNDEHDINIVKMNLAKYEK